jgi:hypothetical protein
LIFSANSIPLTDRRVVESFESEHRPNSLFDSPMVLFDEIVQVLARPHSRSARKFAGLLHLPNRAMPASASGVILVGV